MNERTNAYERRTGSRYDPPPELRAIAKALGAAGACPTLFRHPGALGLRDLLQGGPFQLAPADAPWVWLSEEPLAERKLATRLFGTAAVLEPLRLDPCRTREPGLWLAVNRAIADAESLVWVPPSVADRPIDWSRVSTAEQAREQIGSVYELERKAVVERLSGYLEELGELERAGVTWQDAPWYAQAESVRRELLDRHGLARRWT